MSAVAVPQTVPVGRINRFGPFGTKYEVGSAVRQLEDGDWMVEITMVDSGAKTEYRLTRPTNDPGAC